MTTSIDRRTRFAGAAMVMDAEHLFADLSERLQDNGRLAARGVELLDLPPLTLEVDGTAAHLVVADGVSSARGRADDGTDPRSTHRVLGAVPGRRLDVRARHAGRVECGAARADQFVAWEPALRAAIDGRAVYEPGRSDSATATATTRPAPIFPRQRRPRGHRPVPRRGGLPAPRRGVHRSGDGGGIGGARRAMGPRAPDNGASWWARTEDGGIRRASSGSTSSRRPCRSCAIRTGSSASARSPTTP